ncbi:MAG: glycosyltransferase [Actinomycetia bacterium]|nr:glycosyltransferase [Actinomycetes bacterium]
MRIGLFADAYLPYVSGVTNHIRLYKRYYEEQGHEVFLFTFGNRDYPDDEPNVIRSLALPWGKSGWSFSMIYGKEARDLLPTLDLVHVHHPFQSGRMMLPYVKRYNLPLVFTNHTRYDIYSDAYGSLIPQAPRYAFLASLLKSVLVASDLVICPSASIAQWLVEFADYSLAATIPNGIDIEAFAHPRAGAYSREQLGIAPDDVVFCYAGRLSPEKNTDYLFDEFFRAARDLPQAKLLVIGGGKDLDAIRERALESSHTDQVIFTGEQPYSELPGLEALADVFVTGSVSEVHPLVVLEAMAAHLPVVAIDSPGIADTVTHEESGLLGAAPEPGELSDNLVRIARDAELRACLADGAFARASQYALPDIAGQMLERYEQLIAEHRPKKRRGLARGARSGGRSTRPKKSPQTNTGNTRSTPKAHPRSPHPRSPELSD